jgi:hypothetical protein
VIECLSTGLVYRNPKPYLRSRQAFHPSLVRLEDGELICSFDVGEAVESLDYRTYLSRSGDGGRAWTFQGPLFEDRCGRRTSSSVRVSRMSDGTLIGFGGRFYRDDPEEGVTNKATLGYVPMDLILLRSPDGGRTWQGPEVINPPLIGPSFEVCHSVLELPDGRWLAPTATWRGWNGERLSGEKTVVLISEDRGRSWPRYGVCFDGGASGVIHWEVSVISLGGNRVLAVAWAHDPQSGKNLPTPYALSEDGGETFSPPGLTGLRGQTCKALRLSDGRLLCACRRDDRPGLWASLARLDGKTWINEAELPLWGTHLASSGMAGQAASAEELSSLKFGYPSMVQMPDGEVLIVFWCLEDGATNIRWTRLRVR